MPILVIEDQQDVAAMVTRILRTEGYAVDVATNLEDGQHWGAECPYDLVILDRGLGGQDGLVALRYWRSKHRTTPVLILSARTSVTDKLEAFKAGADDYVTKPFQASVLASKAVTLIRRKAGFAQNWVRLGLLEINLKHREIIGLNGIDFTPSEYTVLRMLLLNKGAPMMVSEIIDSLYGPKTLEDRNREPADDTIHGIIRQLREKLGRAGVDPNVLQHDRGRGYILNDQLASGRD